MLKQVHETAIVADSAEIDSEVIIGPYSIIGPNVKIGKRCKIHSHVVIEGFTSIGDDNEFYPFSCIGTHPQDLKFSGEPSTLEIGSNNKIREYVTIQPGTKHGHMRTVVGSHNLFMANSHVGHDCSIGNHIVVANSVGLAGHVTIDDYVILGGLCGVHQFSKVGTLAFIGAGAMVAMDVPPFVIAQGDRCTLRGLNVVGLKRAGFSTSEIASIKKAFRYFFYTTGNINTKIENLPQDLKDQDKVRIITDFIEKSERGIIMPKNSRSTGDAEENSS